ncbi:MAG TPA: hypothetical protein VFI02_16225, partial [Armatimonadota bacterium]|nr:hypothetical protein [Armatimonadota bacterium]
NLFLNVMPRKKESANASDRISSYPDLSKALKQCAGLRKKFLPYFLDGTLIGDCILSEPCPATHITAYVLPDRALMILINQGGSRKVSFACDLAPWVKSSGGYEARAFDEDGKLLGTSKTGSEWHAETKALQSGEMVVFEIKGS